tara:strand:+ start:552 stop:767 length:216 start_codon:yes stop_codon:yes gene_type:complete
MYSVGMFRSKEVNMIILRMYVDQPDVWQETTLENAIKQTEGMGYWKEGTVKEIFEDGQTIRTPWAFYKKKQ